MIGNYSDPRHRPMNPKSSSRIAGTACNGCSMCEVISRKMRFKVDERYYCNRVGRFVEPMGECQAV